MAVSLRQTAAVGSYILRQRLAGRKRYPLVLMLEPLFRCNLDVLRLRQDRLSRRDFEQAPFGAGMPRRGRRVRRADGRHSRRRAADPQGDRRDRQGHRRAQEIRVAVHQRAAPGEEAASVRAVAVSVLLRASRRSQGAPRQIGVHGGRLRAGDFRHQGRQGQGFRRQRQLHDLRRPSGRGHRGIPRSHRRARRRRLDLARLRLRAGARISSTSSIGARPRNCSAKSLRSARARSGT